LRHSKWSQRSFTILRSHVGGSEDDELRRLLVRAGAVRFVNKDDSSEW
jgi:hypothetical protein